MDLSYPLQRPLQTSARVPDIKGADLTKMRFAGHAKLVSETQALLAPQGG